MEHAMTQTVPELTLLDRARIEALFASDLNASTNPDRADVEAAIRTAIRRHHCSGCRDLVAQECGDHPDAAVDRLRWARTTVAAVFPHTPSRHPALPLHTAALIGAGA
jgi:hypothetical protein